MLKLADNPPVLAPWADGVNDLTGRWWVAHTRSRFEKAFAWDLLKRRVGYFLPMVERTRVSGGRKRRVLMPLFGSYVFFCGSPADRLGALTTGRLCRAIEVAEQDRLVAELSSLEAALRADEPLAAHPFGQPGQRCRVTGGALEGLEGIVVRRAQLTRLVLQVSILGRAVAMEIDADLLEAID